MLRELGNPKNAPSITREIKAPAVINRLGLPLEAGTHTGKPPIHNLTEDTGAYITNTLNHTQLQKTQSTGLLLHKSNYIKTLEFFPISNVFLPS